MHYEAIATAQPGAVHNLIGMTALVMWPKLLYFVKLDYKPNFILYQALVQGHTDIYGGTIHRHQGKIFGGRIR